MKKYVLDDPFAEGHPEFRQRMLAQFSRQVVDGDFASFCAMAKSSSSSEGSATKAVPFVKAAFPPETMDIGYGEQLMRLTFA